MSPSIPSIQRTAARILALCLVLPGVVGGGKLALAGVVIAWSLLCDPYILPLFLLIFLFVAAYEMVCLILWGLLVIVACGRGGIGFVRFTWIAHFLFNGADSLFCLGSLLIGRGAVVWPLLYSLGIALAIMACSACFLCMTLFPGSTQPLNHNPNQ